MIRQHLALAVLPLLLASTTFAADPVFKAGVAERDITPEIGMEAPGGYGKVYHKSIHDPCKVRASVFDDGKSRVAIVGIDALGIRRDTVLKVRKAIEAKTGIPGGSVMIGASHSHSSGPLVWTLPGEFDHASPMIQDLAYHQSTNADPKYLAMVEKGIIDAVVAANEARIDSKTGVGKGSEDKVAFNRRFFMKNGHTVSHPGLGNPDIIEPAGPVDPEVGVVGSWDAKNPGKLLGCIVNFSCHATTSGPGVSANYIYYLEKAIQGYYGKGTVVVFLAGMSGDVTQVDNRSAHPYPDGDRWAQIVGGRVGAEALKVLLAMEPGRPSPLAVRTDVREMPRRAPSAKHLADSLEVLKRDRAKTDPTEWTFAKETVMLDAILKKEPTATSEVQVVQVGPAAFVAVSAEYFCQYGLDIKAGSGFPFTFPVSLANGCIGYVPTTDSFGPRGGGYETRLTSYSNLEIDAGDTLRDIAVKLARELKPGAPIGAPPRPPFKGKPWTYGDVLPQKD